MSDKMALSDCIGQQHNERFELSISGEWNVQWPSLLCFVGICWDLLGFVHQEPVTSSTFQLTNMVEFKVNVAAASPTVDQLK